MTSRPPVPLLQRLYSSLRPDQWVLNLFVYVALVFSGRLLDPELFERATLMVLAFCLASSGLALMESLYGMARYLYLIYVRKLGAHPLTYCSKIGRCS